MSLDLTLVTTAIHGAVRDADGRVRAEVRFYTGRPPEEELSAFCSYAEGAAWRPWLIEGFGGPAGKRGHGVRCVPGKPCASCERTALSWWTEWDNRRIERASKPGGTP